MVVSAGPEAAERDVSALRTAIHEVFEGRKASLMAERQHRASVRLVPRTISLLEQMRGGLLESKEDFALRRKNVDEQRKKLDRELHQHQQRLAQVRDDLTREVRAICDQYQARFAATSDGIAIEQVSCEFTAALATTVRNHFAKLGQQLELHDAGINTTEIENLLKDTDKIVSLGATLATAALFAAISPAAGLAATAGEATGGAALRAVAAKTAAKAGTKTAIKIAASEGLKRVGRSVLTVLHEVNPANIASDFVGEWLKNKRLAEQWIVSAKSFRRKRCGISRHTLSLNYFNLYRTSLKRHRVRCLSLKKSGETTSKIAPTRCRASTPISSNSERLVRHEGQSQAQSQSQVQGQSQA